MTSKRSVERSKLERQVNIRQLKQEASCQRVTSIDATDEGVAFASMIPLRIGANIAVDHPDFHKQAMVLCNIKHCTLRNGKFHIGAKIERSYEGSLTTTIIPAEWRKAD